MRSLTAALASAAIVACGGATGTPDASTSDGSAETGFDDSGLGDCASAQGHRVCRGVHQCTESSADCGVCLKWANPFNPNIDVNDPGVGLCTKGTGYSESGCSLAKDGDVCFSFQDEPERFSFFTAPFTTAQLFLKGGGAMTRIRYADGSLFTGTPLPEPTLCPKLPLARVCGGNCGLCNVGEVCHGRSPLHPYSFCLPIGQTSHGCTKSKSACNAGEGCFMLDDGGAPTQTDGFCIPIGICQDLAQNLPGGGTCLGS